MPSFFGLVLLLTCDACNAHVTCEVGVHFIGNYAIHTCLLIQLEPKGY